MSVNGNVNRLTNGGRASYRLILGELPAKLARVRRNSRAYRRALEDAVQERWGQVDIMAAHAVDSAVAAETHYQICQWLLREKLDTMSVSDTLACSSQMVKAKQARDAAVRQLNLARDTGKSALDLLYGPTPTPTPAIGERTAACESSEPSRQQTAPESTPDALNADTLPDGGNEGQEAD